MATTAWLIGSWHENIAGADIDFNGTTYGVVPVQQPGGVYLYHSSTSLSLIDLVEGVMTSIPIAGASVQLLASGYVKISATGNFTVSWTTPLLRDLLGFEIDLSGDNEYIAPNHSPLWWSPGKPESPTESPIGCLGRPVYDTRFSTAPDGTQVSDSSFTQTVQNFNWPYVTMSRYQTDDGENGEYITFFDYVLRRANKFFLHSGVDEYDTLIDSFTNNFSLGPYGHRPTRSPLSPDFQRSRGFESVDRRANVSLDCIVTPEWTVQ